MAKTDYEQRRYIQTLWETAYEEGILVFDYTGQAEAVTRIDMLKSALDYYKALVRKHKLDPRYAETWNILDKCGTNRISPERIHIVKLPKILYQRKARLRKALPLPIIYRNSHVNYKDRR